MSIIVGLAGPAQAGKDSTADVLVNEFGFVKVSFADGVRDLMELLDPVLSSWSGESRHLSEYPRDEFSWQWLKENTDAREHMVKIGAGGRDVLGADVWITAALLKMQERPWENYVIPDVRYANEASFIRQRGGQVWEVHRPGIEPANEEERRSLEEFTGDRAILNGGSMEDLRSYIISLVHIALPVGVGNEQMSLNFLPSEGGI